MNNKIQFAHDYSEEEGHIITLSVKCRLGAAPKLLEVIIESSIKPLAETYDPHWEPTRLPVQPPDEPQ